MDGAKMEVLYAKYHSTRRPEFRITTEICESEGIRFVRKRAAGKAAEAHLRAMKDNRELLREYYEDIRLIPAEEDGDGLRFPFAKGKTLEEAVAAGNPGKEEYLSRVKEKTDRVLAVREEYKVPFQSTEGFEAVFGDIRPEEGVPAVCPANLDPLLSNFIENDGVVTCIDWEWVCSFPVPVDFLRFRILLYLYTIQTQDLKIGLSLEEMFGWFGIREEEIRLYREMDDRFQQYVHGENRAYIYPERYLKKNLDVEDMARGLSEKEKTIRNLEKVISNREKEVYDKEVHIQDQDVIIRQLTDSFNTISNSFFWKITKPARKTLDGVKGFARRNERVYSALRMAKDLPRQGFRNANKRRKDYLAGKKRARASVTWPSAAVLAKQREEVFPKDVTFSLLVPLFNTPELFLREMIDSVRGQSYPKWELCLADGSDAEHGDVERICREYAGKDKRVLYKKLDRNYGISENTNACVAMATGNYIALFDHDDVLHPSALYEVMKAICEQDADYIYTDEVTFESPDRKKLITYHFKPDFAPDNLLANNYICHFSAFSADLLKKTPAFRTAYDGSQDHDIMLRLTHEARKVVHIPKILYWWRSHPQSVSQDIGAKQYAVDAAKRCVHDFILETRGQEAIVESTRAFPTIFRIIWPIREAAKVSIVIPNKDHVEDLRRCVNSILEKTTYPNYEIVVAENNSETEEIFDYYTRLEENGKIRVLRYPEGFNYSRINNWAAARCAGEYILLLNNDTEVITPEWIENMLMYAQREDVGAVGAKLYYPDGRIQHAGVVIKMGDDRIAAHAYVGAPHDHIGYMGRLCYAQDMSAVTGACLMVRKKVYDEVGGLDEDFAVAYNDIDFCLKIREKGYLNIFTPFTELYHYESASRGYETGEKLERQQRECERFRKKWPEVLEKGDPYFNPNLSLDSPMFEP